MYLRDKVMTKDYARRNTPTIKKGIDSNNRYKSNALKYTLMKKTSPSIYPSPFTTVYSVNTTSHLAVDKCYLLQFDGGSRGNPGLSGSGCVLFGPCDRHGVRQKLVEGGVFIKRATNNEAEYRGLIHGLTLAVQYNMTQLIIEGDSKLVIEQVRGAWQARADHIKILLKTALEQVCLLKYVAIRHIYRNDNKIADALSNETMDSKESYVRISPMIQSQSQSQSQNQNQNQNQNQSITSYFGGLNFII
jgi:ribonuclease HI